MKDFLRSEKYNTRYDILWRFVTGLLAVNNNKDHLCDFLREIEGEPKDLLGPAHQRLLLHCFSEVALSNSNDELAALQENMEFWCQQWSIYEYKRLQRTYFCRKSEFPDNVLSEMLTKLPDNIKISILQALPYRPQLPSRVLEDIINLSKNSDNPKVRRFAAEVLAKQASISDNFLQALVSRLEDTNCNVRGTATEALGKQASLSENILQELASQLDSADSNVRKTAAKVLGKQASLPDNILQALVSQLDSTDFYVKRSVAQALRMQAYLSENILQALVWRLENPDYYVRRSVAQVLDKDYVYYVLPKLQTHTLRTLYRGWIDKSLREQFSCYIQNGYLYFETAQKRRKIALLNGKLDLINIFLTEASAMERPGS